MKALLIALYVVLFLGAQVTPSAVIAAAPAPLLIQVCGPQGDTAG